jgi:hypothetical protein
MTWIKTIPPQLSEGVLRESYTKLYSMYPPEYKDAVPSLIRPDGGSDSIIESHSLLPEVMLSIFTAHAQLLSPELPLSRRQHEMISTVVSRMNQCFY